MKIALIVPGGVDPSGTHRVIPAILALIERLASRHELHVYALRQVPDPAEWELLGARIHNIGLRHMRSRAVRAILREHRRARFDLVQSIFSERCGVIALAAAKLARIPCAVHVAGGEITAIPSIAYGGRLAWKGRVREALVLRLADAVTSASAPMISALEGLGIHATRVPLGIDLKAWPLRPPSMRPLDGPARLLHVASLNRVKDQPTLLRAFARVAERWPLASLDIVGEDVLQQRIHRQAAALGLGERIRFHGFLTQSELRPLVEAAHVLVMSSLHEAGPIVALEAAVAGVPTVGTHVGHIAEWAPEAALSAPPGDDAGLAAHIGTLLGDEARRLAMAAAAQQLAVREDADHTAQRFERLHEDLVARDRRER